MEDGCLCERSGSCRLVNQPHVRGGRQSFLPKEVGDPVADAASRWTTGEIGSATDVRAWPDGGIPATQQTTGGAGIPSRLRELTWAGCAVRGHGMKFDLSDFFIWTVCHGTEYLRWRSFYHARAARPGAGNNCLERRCYAPKLTSCAG